MLTIISKRPIVQTLFVFSAACWLVIAAVAVAFASLFI